jgi:NADH-quinone oxidoreductase subunit H
LPFDLPEAEQELIGGYHTEYSGMKLLLFLIAEFLHMMTAAFLIVILFFGRWHLWGLTGANEDAAVAWPIAILRIVVLGVKVLLVILFFMLIRWSWPRFRFDQLMSLAWKVMLPLGVVNFVTIAVLTEYFSSAPLAVRAAISWIVTIAAWIVAGLLAPLSLDNSPRSEIGPWDSEMDLQ